MTHASAVFLYFTVLAQPNPLREGRREWRVKEIMERAVALTGRPHSAAKVCSGINTCLRRRGHAEVVPGLAATRAVWRLTEEVRTARETAAASFCAAALTSKPGCVPTPPRACATPRA
jgi:hypothetical protein